MTKSSDTTPILERLLAALAVLGRADQQTLAALVDKPLPDRLWTSLGQHAAVEHEAGEKGDENRMALPADVATDILTRLERDDLAAYRTLHGRAVALLAGQLQAGRADVEPAFTAVLERLADRLLKDDPQRLATLLDSIRDVPLATAAGQQRRRYFQAAALFKAEKYIEADQKFEALLAEPALDPTVRARTLNARAVCHRIMGQLEKALAGYEESLRSWRQLGNRRFEGIVLMNMGIVAYQLQDYEEAERHLQQASAIFEAIGSPHWLASTQNELGLVYRDRGQWQAALVCFERYVAQRRTESAQDQIGRGLNNMGEVLLFQGRLAEATAALQAALDKMTTRLYRVDTLLHLGLAHQAGNDLDQAEATFRQALDLAQEIGRREILPHVHYRLGDVRRRRGDEATAQDHFRAAAAVIEATRAPLQDEGVKISLLGRWQQIYEALVLSCLETGETAAAFAWAERARARAFADAIANGREIKESRLAGEATPIATIPDLQSVLPADAAVLCYFTTGVLARDIPLLRAIPAHNPLRAHLHTPGHTFLFTVTKDRLAAHHCNLDPNRLTTTSPRGHDPMRLLNRAVRQRLYTTLLAPAADALTAKQLYIIPHGPLHHVPFAALMDQDEKPLARTDGPGLAYTPSATLLRRHTLAAPQPAASGPGLVVGYRGSDKPLPYSEAEAQAIANLVTADVQIGPEPKKERLRKTAVARPLLHFACHGWFNEAEPMATYLETGRHERLTAREVLLTWRLQAELVTLSACQTGVSRILRGDEPMGLIRAFLYAGAKAVLVSQWAVADVATFLLMHRFYRELGDGVDTADLSRALSVAQEWLRQLTVTDATTRLAQWREEDQSQAGASTRELEHSPLLANQPPEHRPFAHPRFWAAFILVGRTSSASFQ